MRSLVKFILSFFRKPSKSKSPLYSIGNIKHHNSLVDTLIPQFVEIGDNFISAPGSIVLAHDASLYLHTGEYRCERTVIGDNVFLGANSVILPGITIGNGAIIGAGAIVTRNVEAFTVVAGNPAKYICHVNDYLEKCRQKNTLYMAPNSFSRLKKGERISRENILEFQKIVLAESVKTK